MKTSRKRTSWVSLLVLLIYGGAVISSLAYREISYYRPIDVKEPSKIEIETTAYSSLDSCHYEGCKMASGIKAYVGAIACPRDWELGVKVKIGDKVYTCEDRYNPGFSDRLDIFVGFGKEAHKAAQEYGVKKVEALVLN